MDFVTRQFIVLAKKLRKDVRSILNTIHRDLEKQTKAINNAAEAANNQARIPPKITTEANLPEGVEIRKSEADANEEKHVNVVSTIIASLTLTVVAIYSTINYYQLQEMRYATQAADGTLAEAQKQTQFLRQQLVGTQEAIVRPDIQHFEDLWQVQMTNIGHVDAKNFHSTISVERVGIYQGKLIGKLKDIETTIPVFPQGSSGVQPPVVLYEIPKDWTPLTWDNFIRTGATLQISVSLRYDNGFGDSIHSTTCNMWIPFYQIRTLNGLATSGGAAPCSRFHAALRDIIRRKEDESKGVYH